jgi:hypothetical protein
MAILNQLMSEQDLARLSYDEREFLVERIDHMIANILRSPDSEAHKMIAQGLHGALGSLGKQNMKVLL